MDSNRSKTVSSASNRFIRMFYSRSKCKRPIKRGSNDARIERHGGPNDKKLRKVALSLGRGLKVRGNSPLSFIDDASL